MLSKVFIFVAGAAIGSVATWKFVKTKYEQIADEEIESMREYYNGKLQNLADESSKRMVKEFEEGLTVQNAEITEQAASMVHEAYENYASLYQSKEERKEEEEEEDEMEDRPYVISPEEFGEEGYEQVSLTYYADGVLTNESDDVIEDVDDLIGEESLEHFGEYEDDSVFVRDDSKGIDYEILKDLRNYYGD